MSTIATNRRTLLKGGALTALAMRLGWPAGAQADPACGTTLWYDRPAAQWVEALPIGNGRLGAMVFGGIGEERLQINEDTLWSGGPYDSANPEARAALPDVRALIFAGRYAEAEALADAKLMARPLRQAAYASIGDLVLNFRGDIDSATGYRRELDLDTGMARTRYTLFDTAFVREAFASTPDGVMVLRIAATNPDKPRRLGFDLTWHCPLEASSVADGATLRLCGRNDAANGIAGALRFCAAARVVAKGGRVAPRAGGLTIAGADEALLLIAAATSYRRYDDVGGDPEAAVEARLAAAEAKGFDRLMADHLADHRALFRRVRIDLGGAGAGATPTDARVAADALADDPALAALYFQYARYLLIAASRPGSQPANLQGIWNGETDPPWGSKYTVNINTEMNYWPAEAANLAECVSPLLALVRDLAETGARTAKTMYGARGWVCHHNTDLWRATAPIDGAKYGVWPMGGAWLCNQLWESYDFSGDTAYLKTLYPLMVGAAQFFLDTLVEEPTHGWLVTCPSLSPENVHPFGASVCAGPAMDAQLLRDLFAHCIEAATVLKRDAGFVDAVRKAAARLPPPQVGKLGQLQEWLEDWDAEAPDPHHRHVSHLYGAFPSAQINVRDTPALCDAVRKSLAMRGDLATGWGTAWRLNLWARLGDGEHAYRILKMLLGPARTYANLFDAHPPFQIDGNFGGASGMIEMLLQSWGGEIRLLPALPTAWPRGEIAGLRARRGFDVDIRWSGGVLDAAVLRSRHGGRTVVVYGGERVTLDLKRGGKAMLGWRKGRLFRV